MKTQFKNLLSSLQEDMDDLKKPLDWPHLKAIKQHCGWGKPLIDEHGICGTWVCTCTCIDCKGAKK